MGRKNPQKPAMWQWSLVGLVWGEQPSMLGWDEVDEWNSEADSQWNSSMVGHELLCGADGQQPTREPCDCLTSEPSMCKVSLGDRGQASLL